jgi:hypothetical protein
MVRPAESHPNRLLYSVYGLMYLLYASESLDASEQVAILENLKGRSCKEMFKLHTGQYIGFDFGTSILPVVKGLAHRDAGDVYLLQPLEKPDHGPFIYNPFSRFGALTEKVFESVLLLAGERAEFRLHLCNPFMFPVTLNGLCLAVDAEDSVSEATSVTLPPMTSTHNVSVYLTPKRSGKLSILGCSFAFLNIATTVYFDENGHLTRNKGAGMCISVLEPQPRLRLEGPNDIHYTLYSGETLESSILLRNENSIPLDQLSVSFSVVSQGGAGASTSEQVEELLFGTDCEIVRFDKFSLTSEETGPLVRVPFRIYGKGSCTQIKCVISYSGSQTSNCMRRVSVVLHVTTRPSVTISDLCFFPIQGAEAQATSSCWTAFLVSNSCPDDLVLSWHCGERPRQAELVRGDSFCLSSQIPVLKDTEVNLGKLPLSQQQMASLRKLTRPDLDGFVDETYVEAPYDSLLYWCKRHFIRSTKLCWHVRNAPSSHGEVSFVHLEIADVFKPVLVQRRTALWAEISSEGPYALGERVDVTIYLQPQHAEGRDYCLQMVPVVDLGNDHFAVDYESVLRYSGVLKTLIMDASLTSPKSFTISFYPIAFALSRILIKASERLNAENILWCEYPVSIECIQ